MTDPNGIAVEINDLREAIVETVCDLGNVRERAAIAALVALVEGQPIDLSAERLQIRCEHAADLAVQYADALVARLYPPELS